MDRAISFWPAELRRVSRGQPVVFAVCKTDLKNDANLRDKFYKVSAGGRNTLSSSVDYFMRTDGVRKNWRKVPCIC